MSTKLTDTQLLMLGAAAQRKDRCVAAPPNLKGAAAQKFAADLVDAGLAKEVKARPGAHIWRCDDVTRQAYALKLTPAGLKTIRVEETEVLGTAIETSPTPAGEGPRKTKVHDSRAGSVAPPGTIAAPREGSKLAKVIGLLQREDGATIDQLADAMGWLPHTTRAALTGLRKRGFEIDRRKRKDQRAGAYVIVNSQTATKG
jgi:Protein of unknown function (DUF3489)